METVTLDVRDPGSTVSGFLNAWTTGKTARGNRISFAGPALHWRVLTAKRWELLKAMCGASPLSAREVARRVGRDFKAVHSDLTALFAAGVLVLSESGRLASSCEAVKVEFLLQAA